MNTEEDIKILEEFTQIVKGKDYNAENGWHGYYDDELITLGKGIENLIKGYRDSEDIMKNTVKENLELKEYIRELEKHIAFYEKHGSYKARIVELEEQVEYLKHEVELAGSSVEKLVKEKMAAKAKVDSLLKELLRKLDEPCDDRWEKDNKDYYAKIKAQINIIKQLKEE